MKIEKFLTDFNNQIFFKKLEKSDNNNIISFNDEQINQDENQTILINPNNEFQSFLGFGAALTEASGYCFNLLSNEKKQDFLDDCFSENGLNYNLLRLTIASSDFSLKSYSYSYKKDLHDFSTQKDEEYVLPLIKAVQNYKADLTFLSSPWSPPRFMKSNKLLIFGGKLLDKYKSIYAEYICKYILDYKEKGITINYITIQNEPEATQVWESCRYTAEQEADFAINFLYPTFKQNNISTKILAWDHNKDLLFKRANDIMNYPNANDILSGFAHHWYTGDYFENVKQTHEQYPDKLLIHSEGCTGYSHFNPNDEIKNAEMYAHDIIGDINSGINGYIDWNIMLNNQGGPNHKKNYCNSPIMLTKDNTDYIKNLSYYYIKHFSNLIKPNAKVIEHNNSQIEVASFKNIDNSIIIILLNKTEDTQKYHININNKMINDNIESHTIISYKIIK